MKKETSERFNFTPTRLNKATHKGDKPDYFIYDDSIDGLRLKITRNGVKTFEFRRWDKIRKKAVRVTIDRWKGNNLLSVRERAEGYLVNMLEGRDPQEEKIEKRNELSFDHYAQGYIKDQVDRGLRDAQNVESRYRNHVKPHLGNKRISEITLEVIKAGFHNLPKQKSNRGKGTTTISRTTANRCLKVVRGVFAMPALEHLNNPAAKVKEFSEMSRSRFCKPDELRRLTAKLHTVSEDFALVFRLALLTGARKENLLSMQSKDIDFDLYTWTIPAEQSKNKENMIIPLIPEAVELIEQRRKDQRTAGILSKYIFPSDSESGHIADIKRAWAKLKREAGVDSGLRFHDLRRSVGSYMAQAGLPLNQIGAVLGHKDLKTTLVYARLSPGVIAESLATGVSHMMEQAEKAGKKVVNLRKGE